MRMSLVCFIRLYRKKTLHLKDDKCSGGKHSKSRMTGLDAANMNGDKLPMFAIGKSKKSRCFKNVKNYLVVTETRTKAGWIQHFSKIWSVSLRINLKKETGKLHSSLIPVQPDHFFLPPNTTSASQPMDRGIIRSSKRRYRTKVV